MRFKSNFGSLFLMKISCILVAQIKMRNYNICMNELLSLRKELGLTQEQTASICGVSRRTYQTYEEKGDINKVFKELLEKLDSMGVLDGSNYILNIKTIKRVANEVFTNFSQIKCAYLYGSYARNEATGKSDVDILVVCEPMGLTFYGLVSDLEEKLHKKVDLQTFRQIEDNKEFVQKILIEGIKIYG